MGVTTVSVISRQEEVAEDPFLETLRARFENEIQVLVRHGEIKVRVLDVIQTLQVESQQEAKDDKKRLRQPQMVAQADLLSRLRRKGINDEQDFISEALRGLVAKGRLCRESYSGPYWIVPTEHQNESYVSHLFKLALILTEKRSAHDKANGYHLENYRFEALRNWFAIEVELPPYVVGEYVLPKALEKLTSQEYFRKIVEGTRVIFVNHHWKIQDTLWERWIKQAETATKRSGNKFQAELLQKLPYSNDGLVYYDGYLHPSTEAFAAIVRILQIPIDNEYL
jgi:hypothetical protein